MAEYDGTIQAIRARINVTKQMVTIAKGYFLKTQGGSSEPLINSFLQTMGLEFPKQILAYSVPNPEQYLMETATVFSWWLAGAEAIWALIHSNYFLPTLPNLTERSIVFKFFTNPSGSSFGSQEIRDLIIPVPVEIKVVPTVYYNRQSIEVLIDGDVYLTHLAIKNIDSEVEKALKEAVLCFRNELFTACLAMLGRAIEGTWFEVGLALLNVPGVPEQTKRLTEFNNPKSSIAKKMRDITDLIKNNHQTIFKSTLDQSGYKFYDFVDAFNWSDVVRDSRNSIHYGNAPSLPNTYEKVAALLIGAVPHLKILYEIKLAAEFIKSSFTTPSTGIP